MKNNKLFKLVSIIWLLSGVFKSDAIAAEIYLNQNEEFEGDEAVQSELLDGSGNIVRPYCHFFLKGRILQGDAEIFERRLGDAYDLVHEFSEDYPTLCLDSSGGDYLESLAIARIVKERFVNTALRKNVSCLSGCALIFMAGSSRGSNFHGPDRKMHPTALLGFNAPFIASTTLLKLDSNAIGVSEFYGLWLIAMHNIIDIFAQPEYSRFEYDRKPWMRTNLILSMLVNNKDQYFMVDTVGKAGNFDIGLFGYKKPDLTKSEIVSNVCKNVYLWQRDWFSDAKIDLILLEKGMERWELNISNVNHNYGPGKEVLMVILNEGGGAGPICSVVFDHDSILEYCGIVLNTWDGRDKKTLCGGYGWAFYDLNTRLVDISE